MIDRTSHRWLLAAALVTLVCLGVPTALSASRWQVPTAVVVERGVTHSGPAADPLYFQKAARSTAHDASSAVIRVDDRRRYQSIWGVGAAMTNSSAFLIEHGLASRARAKLVEELFDPDRAGLSFVRVSIGGSDFNVGGVRYSEDDMPPGATDPALRHFTLKHDLDMIAALHQARSVNPHIHIIASPWSAPGWMKTNDSLQDVGFQGHFKPQYYASYANYFVKFIRGYQRALVPIWGITVQNEPFGVPASYEGMLFSAQEEELFVRKFLRPALRRAHLHPYIFALDASWDGVSYAHAELRSGAGFSGVAWHCYTGDADPAMRGFGSTMQVLSECAPNLIHGFVPALVANMFNDGAGAAALWTMATDPSGGPVVPPNQTCHGCRGIVTIDPQTGGLTYNRDYFGLRQFGHFLDPGAVRIYATRLGHFDNTQLNRASVGLHTVAFRNPDGTDVLVVVNNDTTPRSFTVLWRGTTLVSSVARQSTVTLAWATS